MSSTKSYWDVVAEETKSEKSPEFSEERIAFRNWVTAYADAKAKDLILKTFDRFITLGHDARILDVGCGPGKWTRLFADKGFFTTGIDASARMISLAKERTNESVWKRIQLYVMDVAKLGFRDEVFDFVNCVTVLQHNLDDQKWKSAVREINRVTKPSGHILFYEVATAFPFKKRTQNLRFRTLKEYENAFAEYGTRLIFSLPTDTSFPLTVFSLRKFSTTLNRDDAYSYWTRQNKVPLLPMARSITSKTIAKIAGQFDYTLGKTPLGLLSPLRILLFKRR
jgi:ubiquinone/menaquinone biosynthesis C-methylase UbiE